MLAVISSGALVGIEAVAVQVEVNSGETGELRLVLVGLPDAAVKESQDRVFSAMMNSGYRLPKTRTTVNLAPGSIRKEGPMYDLPMALGVMAATGQLMGEGIGDYVIAGELSLSGEVKGVKGGLALGVMAKREGKRGVLLPRVSAEEAALVEGLEVYAVRSLNEAVMFLSGKVGLERLENGVRGYVKEEDEVGRMDFFEVKGQRGLRRAIEVAVAGGHNLLMIGPPGSGKSMIAKRIPTIMPEPSVEEFLEILRIQSVAGITMNGGKRRYERPFRAPHHTISDVGLLGGGAVPGPGEVSLAHHGVLFMDEFPEFRRSTLEVLRQPLEDGYVAISRSAGKITFPSGMMLVAAMNPCPCGYLGDRKKACRCGTTQIERYRGRLSGPLLDRIDIHIEAPALTIEELQGVEVGESSEVMRERVSGCREVQMRRGGVANARMSHKQIREYCEIGVEEAGLLQQAMEQLNLSARSYDRILKVARTIADMDRKEAIETVHLLEAIQYRTLDRNFLG